MAIAGKWIGIYMENTMTKQDNNDFFWIWLFLLLMVVSNFMISIQIRDIQKMLKAGTDSCVTK